MTPEEIKTMCTEIIREQIREILKTDYKIEEFVDNFNDVADIVYDLEDDFGEIEYLLHKLVDIHPDEFKDDDYDDEDEKI